MLRYSCSYSSCKMSVSHESLSPYHNHKKQQLVSKLCVIKKPLSFFIRPLSYQMWNNLVVTFNTLFILQPCMLQRTSSNWHLRLAPTCMANVVCISLCCCWCWHDRSLLGTLCQSRHYRMPWESRWQQQTMSRVLLIALHLIVHELYNIYSTCIDQIAILCCTTAF